MTYPKLVESLKESLFETIMSGQGLDTWSNYLGHDWSGWFCGPSKTRDSEMLDESNFDVALSMLGGEVDGSVEIRSVNHWACGYFDQIMVKNDKSNIKAIKSLYEIKKMLEQYPVLDDSDYSEREDEEFSEYAYSRKSDVADTLQAILGLDDTLIDWSVDIDSSTEKFIGQIRPQLEAIAFSLNMDLQYGGYETLDTIRKYYDGTNNIDAVLKQYAKAFNGYETGYNFADCEVYQTLKHILNSIA